MQVLTQQPKSQAKEGDTCCSDVAKKIEVMDAFRIACVRGWKVHLLPPEHIACNSLGLPGCFRSEGEHNSVPYEAAVLHKLSLCMGRARQSSVAS